MLKSKIPPSPQLALVMVMAGLMAIWPSGPTEAQQTDIMERFREMSARAEAAGLADPFLGVTTNGEALAGLFPVRSTGVSTQPVKEAAEGFLASLTPDQRGKTVFAVDDPEWRKWMNQHFYIRQGTGFDEMTGSQRDAAIGLLRASLSAEGLQLTRDIMKLNHTLGELNDNNFVEYGEWLYWITLMGEPSTTEPWGWQLDGHHVIINYFVLGDQVVMTPFFLGSEPVRAESGKYEGVEIMQDEQDQGLALLRALNDDQRSSAVIEVSKEGNNTLGEAFKDNIVLDYAGVSVSTFTSAQKKQLLDLIGLYVGNMADDHAKVKMSEVESHLDETHFAWIGGQGDDAVFYYRIHSPVILIEFDHQRPAGIRHLLPPGPTRQHIHAVVRTPNGNDYGKDLLRQHYKKHSHPTGGKHQHD